MKHLIALVFGIVGVLLTLWVIHLYQDHRDHHALIQLIVNQQKAQATK